MPSVPACIRCLLETANVVCIRCIKSSTYLVGLSREKSMRKCVSALEWSPTTAKDAGGASSHLSQKHLDSYGGSGGAVE